MTIYQRLVQLKRDYDKQKVKRGTVAFTNLSGKLQFILDWGRRPSGEFVLTIHDQEEYLVWQKTSRSYFAKIPATQESMMERLWFDRGLSVVFFDRKDLQANPSYLNYLEEVGQVEKSNKWLPMVLEGCVYYRENGPISKEAERLLEKVLDVLFTQDNLHLVWHKAHSFKKNNQEVPLLAFNQRTKVLVDRQETLKWKDLVEAAKPLTAPFFEENPLPVHQMVSYYGRIKALKEKQGQGILELALTISPEQYKAHPSPSDPVFFFSMADDTSIFTSSGFQEPYVTSIQKAFMYMLGQASYKPEIILSAGVFGQYLKNALAPLVDEMGIDFDLVDVLPVHSEYGVVDTAHHIKEQTER